MSNLTTNVEGTHETGVVPFGQYVPCCRVQLRTATRTICVCQTKPYEDDRFSENNERVVFLAPPIELIVQCNSLNYTIHKENGILITIVKKKKAIHPLLSNIGDVCFWPILFSWNSRHLNHLGVTGGHLSGMKFKENKKRYDNYLGKIINILIRKD